MADRKWIERVVDTRGRLCPYISKKCIGDRCTFWLKELVTDLSGSSSPDLIEGCLVGFQYVMLNEVTVENRRLAAGIDKASTQTHAVATQLQWMNSRPRAYLVESAKSLEAGRDSSDEPVDRGEG